MQIYKDEDIRVTLEDHIGGTEYEIKIYVDKEFIGEDVIGLVGVIRSFVISVNLLMKI